MRRLVAVALALAALAACAGPDHGAVVRRWDVAAHDESYVESIWVGQTCRTTKVGKTETTSCSPRYVYVPRTRRVDRACFVRLRAGESEGDRALPCDQWEGVVVGDYLEEKK